MGLPKRKLSKSRKGKRRSHHKISAPNLTKCPKCHAPKRQHYICEICGFYEGKQIIEIKKKGEKKGEDKSRKEARK